MKSAIGKCRFTQHPSFSHLLLLSSSFSFLSSFQLPISLCASRYPFQHYQQPLLSLERFSPPSRFKEKRTFSLIICSLPASFPLERPKMPRPRPDPASLPHYEGTLKKYREELEASASKVPNREQMLREPRLQGKFKPGFTILYLPAACNLAQSPFKGLNFKGKSISTRNSKLGACPRSCPTCRNCDRHLATSSEHYHHTCNNHGHSPSAQEHHHHS